MAFRRLLRGKVEWDRLEAVARAIGARYELSTVRVEFLRADNWLSTPCVVNDRYFVKIISQQNALVHGLLTTGRNLGAFSSGTEGFFERFDDPVEMAEHELEAAERMREIGVDAPRPIEAFECEGLGVLVLEYLPSFRSLSELDRAEARSFAPALFEALATMHANSLGHGDLRAENVLVADGTLHFIDATNVRDDSLADVRAYDLACALGVLEPIVGAKDAVRAAGDQYPVEDLLAAEDFLDFVNIRPDHDFDAASVKGEIEKAAAEPEVTSGSGAGVD